MWHADGRTDEVHGYRRGRVVVHNAFSTCMFPNMEWMMVWAKKKGGKGGNRTRRQWNGRISGACTQVRRGYLEKMWTANYPSKFGPDRFDVWRERTRGQRSGREDGSSRRFHLQKCIRTVKPLVFVHSFVNGLFELGGESGMEQHWSALRLLVICKKERRGRSVALRSRMFLHC